MKKADLQKFRKLFVAQKESILNQQSLLDEGLMNRPEDKDEVDQANADVEQRMRMQMKSRETEMLRMIEIALRRIDEGSFGECQSCGCDIELKRLQARPTATLCISCKEEEERMMATAVLGHRARPAISLSV